MTKAKVKKLMCSICHRPIERDTLTGWEHGHNAQPINDGRCCSDCNSTVVIPARLRRHFTTEASS